MAFWLQQTHCHFAHNNESLTVSLSLPSAAVLFSQVFFFWGSIVVLLLLLRAFFFCSWAHRLWWLVWVSLPYFSWWILIYDFVSRPPINQVVNRLLSNKFFRVYGLQWCLPRMPQLRPSPRRTSTSVDIICCDLFHKFVPQFNFFVYISFLTRRKKQQQQRNRKDPESWLSLKCKGKPPMMQEIKSLEVYYVVKSQLGTFLESLL